MGNLESVTVIIPVRPGEIPERALASVRKMDYPVELLQVLIAEGWFPSLQRNEAARKASGDILYFLDDDSDAPPDTIKKFIRHFREKDADVIGGPSLAPEGDTFLQKCFAEYFASPFGGFNIRHRHKISGSFRRATERELISCNLAIKKEVYLKEGGLREELYPNEENEFLDRLNAKGYVLFYDPQLFVFRSQRRTIFQFLRQLFTYGRGRMDQTFVNPVFIKIYHFIPMAFVLYLFSLLLDREFYFMLPLFLYAGLNIFFSMLTAKGSRKIGYFFLMPVIFFAGHTSYGMGSWWGVLKKILRLRTVRPSMKITVREISLYQ